MLPRVKINFENGALGSVAPSEDGVIGLIVTGYAVTDFFEIEKNNSVFPKIIYQVKTYEIY